eukprot:TRINITY_DN4021_c0_g1_i1.p1 TRINITY_DN4021_c0_g1~~TRINITY_DN4021_c0_g1_i1.p1  ORF type:complete len:638 (-),score=85.72 TRINITY_DN4021_c0_g1_i1:91-1923(-)
MITGLSTISFVAVASSATALVSTRYPSESTFPVVETEYGNVEGITWVTELEFKNVDAFMGMPFAAAPTGENRLRPPQPFTDAWAPKTRQAKLPAQICDQVEGAGMFHLGGEDCLYLNVFRPHGSTSDSKLPVLVWIYGGGFFVGDGYEYTLYDGTNLVKTHEYVVVTMNYRMSGFGFFALPELAAESNGTTGNYGVQDQRAAMQWVQRNIKHFGGDPAQVTIDGQSAGAFSVMFHLASRDSKGLFRAAIMQSGTSNIDWFFQGKTDAFEFYSEFAAILGCSNPAERLACLRKLPAHVFMIPLTQVLKDAFARVTHLPLPHDIPDLASPLWPLMPFGPVVDGTAAGLMETPLELVRRGEFSKVPLLLGSNKDDGAYFGPLVPFLTGDIGYHFSRVVSWILPSKVDQEKVTKIYGTPDFKHDLNRISRMLRDVVFQCSNRNLATEWQKAGLPAYLYMFSFDFKGLIGRLLGDAHAFELPFVFRNYVEILGDLVLDKKRYKAMSDKMTCTWASFVKCLSPKCPSSPPHCDDALKTLPEWPAFSADHREYMSLKDYSTVETIQSTTIYEQTDEFPGDDRCNFWATANLGWQNIRNASRNKILTKPSSASATMMI